jgi:hypothetical protein
LLRERLEGDLMRLALLLALAATTVLEACDGKCTGPLSEVGASCPPTFDGNVDAVCTITDPIPFEWAFACGELNVLSASSAFSAIICSYDGRTHVLVGAEVRTDIESYCDKSSINKVAGRVPPGTCYQGGATSQKMCPRM